MHAAPARYNFYHTFTSIFQVLETASAPVVYYELVYDEYKYQIDNNVL